jgi:hypothetical protein
MLAKFIMIFLNKKLNVIATKKQDLDKLNQNNLYKVLRETFPKQNDFFATDYVEEYNELLDFGINSKSKLIELLAKHQETAMEIDASELSELDEKMFIEEYGEEYVKDRIINKYWFTYSGLLRLILELEFGEKYTEYANKRDNV